MTGGPWACTSQTGHGLHEQPSPCGLRSRLCCDGHVPRPSSWQQGQRPGNPRSGSEPPGALEPGARPRKATQTRPAGVVLGQTLCQVAREIRFPRKVTHSDGKLGGIFLTEGVCPFLEGRWPPVQHFMVCREVSRAPCAPRRKPCASEGSPGRLPPQVGGGSPLTYPSTRICPWSPFRPRSGVFSGSCPRS